MPVVTVKGSNVRIRVDDGKSILEGLYTAGYSYLIGCRRGGCAICKLDLVEGEVEYRQVVADTVLSEQEKAEGTCLSCRAVPVTDVVIAMRQGGVRKTNPFLATLYAAPDEEAEKGEESPTTQTGSSQPADR